MPDAAQCASRVRSSYGDHTGSQVVRLSRTQVAQVMSTEAQLAQPTRIVAPYITQWGAEQDLTPRLVVRPGGGVGYASELPADRDDHDVLWQQVTARPGLGKPEFGKVHPWRQRRAMRELLCQVCAGPADRTRDGVLWLLRDYRGDWPSWPEGMGSVEPPICAPCVATSLRRCPALQRGAVAVRAREFPIAGVRGTLYRQGVLAPAVLGVANLPYDDPNVRWMVAAAQIRELRRCTFISAEGFLE
ncbi:hypothetical protein SAMN05660733_06898 [Lentzea albidocapillata]|uniref:Uncharacterized protein n=1 Tax=Lentzea albidocapillata TaxID=40571 RepID=A0A1W2FLX0_9PSEU|nr:hypothetical protein SAMN05660733_06898 [Lentzea albidocapillata]